MVSQPETIKKDANSSDKYLFFIMVSLIVVIYLQFYILRERKSIITLILIVKARYK